MATVKNRRIYNITNMPDHEVVQLFREMQGELEGQLSMYPEHIIAFYFTPHAYMRMVPVMVKMQGDCTYFKRGTADIVGMIDCHVCHARPFGRNKEYYGMSEGFMCYQVEAKE